MKQWITVTALATLLFLAASSYAGEATPTASSGEGIRIAYVDLERVTENSQAIRERVASVQKELEEKQKVFKGKSDDLRTLTQQLQQQESVTVSYTHLTLPTKRIV